MNRHPNGYDIHDFELVESDDADQPEVIVVLTS